MSSVTASSASIEPLMAVELCEGGVVMEAIGTRPPFSFLDNHIQHGNSSWRHTSYLQRISDEAFEPIEGDDKEVAKRLKKRIDFGRKEGQTLI